MKCPGYHKEWKFSFHYGTPDGQNSLNPRATAFQSRSAVNSNGLVAQQSAGRLSQIAQPPIDERFAPFLVRAALDQQYREGFCSFCEVACAGQFNAHLKLVDVTWLDVARRSRAIKSNQALDWVMRCMGSLHLGLSNGDEQQILASRDFYGRALQHVAWAISSPSLALTAETLAAVKLLYMYEVSNSTDQESRVTHIDGVSTLIRLRGPQAHTHGLGRTMFLFRPFLVREAFARSERCFLEDEEWRATIPETLKHQKALGRGSRFNELIEYAFYEIARCPGLLAQTRTLVATSNPRSTGDNDLVHRIICCRQKLCELQAELLAGFSAGERSIYQDYREFIGDNPPAGEEKLGKSSIEGIGSAIALLHQLLVVLSLGNGQRSLGVTYHSSSSTVNAWDVLGDPTVKKAIEDGKRTHLPPGPQPDEHRDSWFDRVSMSMGMLE